MTNKEKIEAAEKRIIELQTLIKHWRKKMDFEQLQSKITERRWIELLEKNDFKSYLQLTKERILQGNEKILEKEYTDEFTQDELNQIFANNVVNSYCLIKLIKELVKKIEELEKEVDGLKSNFYNEQIKKLAEE